jgi:hypothetical protein
MPAEAKARQTDEDDDARHRREEAERRAKRKVDFSLCCTHAVIRSMLIQSSLFFYLGK